jgi:DNA-directed RNA polymerase specialized sigma24 family protein
MMIGDEKTDEPPSLSDLDGWKGAANDGRLAKYRSEDIVAAIQRIGSHGDQKLRGDLLVHISNRLTRIIRPRVGRNHSNGGEDIVQRAHDRLIVAILMPGSADGKALRKTFRACVQSRLADAIRSERLHAARYLSFSALPQPDGNVEDETEAFEQSDGKPANQVEQEVHVERVLQKIDDQRKQRAFRLHMEGVPLEPGKGTTSIAQELSVSAKTAGKWIAEVQEFLKTEIGVSNV